MKTFLTALIMMSLGGFVLGCANNQAKGVPENAVLKTVTLKVEGMTCGGCEYNVKKTLLKLEGVIEASADHQKGEASVKYIEGQVTSGQLIKAVNGSGYKATLP